MRVKIVLDTNTSKDILIGLKEPLKYIQGNT